MIQSITGIDALYQLESLKSKSDTEQLTSGTLFTEVLESAKSLLQATKEAEGVSSQLTYDFMTGANDNIHNLLIAAEKSSILLYYTMQTRNKVLEAYQEIMRISV